MKTLNRPAILCLLVILSQLASLALGQDSQAGSSERFYRLQPGDLVTVTVFQEPDLSAQQKLDPDGVVIVPLLGRISLVGLTLREAETRLEELFVSEQYLISPQITVTVSDYADQVFYIFGEVVQPGAKSFPNGRQSLDILEAITMAGDLTPYAKRSEIVIRRPQSDSNRELKITVDLDDFIKGDQEESRALPQIYPNDRIFVPERLF